MLYLCYCPTEIILYRITLLYFLSIVRLNILCFLKLLQWCLILQIPELKISPTKFSCKVIGFKQVKHYKKDQVLFLSCCMQQ